MKKRGTQKDHEMHFFTFWAESDPPGEAKKHCLRFGVKMTPPGEAQKHCLNKVSGGGEGGGWDAPGGEGGGEPGLGEDAGGLDLRRMTLQEITFIGTYTYTAQDFRDTAAALFDGRLGPLDWTEIRPLSDGAAAFRDIRSGQSAAPKIILQPDNQGV